MRQKQHPQLFASHSVLGITKIPLIVILLSDFIFIVKENPLEIRCFINMPRSVLISPLLGAASPAGKGGLKGPQPSWRRLGPIHAVSNDHPVSAAAACAQPGPEIASAKSTPCELGFPGKEKT